MQEVFMEIIRIFLINGLFAGIDLQVNTAP